MKEERNGFTLIELLAVIVILAIIALIATPIIMGVIEDARKGAHKDAALGFGKAVETAIATEMIKCPNMKMDTTDGKKIDKDNIPVTGCDDSENVKSGNLAINYQGTQPETVEVTYSEDTGKLTGSVTFGGSTKYSVETGEVVE